MSTAVRLRRARVVLGHATTLALLVAAPAFAQEPAAPTPGETVIVTQAPPPGSVPIPKASDSPRSAQELHTADSQAEHESGKAQPGTASWSPEDGFTFGSSDGNYRLRVGIAVAYRYEMVRENKKTGNGPAFFVARPYVAGNVFKQWIQFWTSFEFANNGPFLLDSFLEIQPIPEFGVRIGQQWTPLSRHEYLGPQQILFPEWSPVPEYFWTGRDKGMTVLGSLFQGKVDYWAGIYCGSPLRQFQCTHGSWVGEARVTVNPMGPVATHETPYITSPEPVPTRFSFTLQTAGGDYRDVGQTYNPAAFRFEPEETGPKRKQRLAAADVWFQTRWLTLLVEGYVRTTDVPSAAENRYRSTGVWAQSGVMVWKRTMDVGARFNWLDPSNHLGHDVGYTLEGQVAYYPFHNQMLVAKLRYGFADQKSPGADALGSVDLLTNAGKTHLLTLQLGLAI